MKRIMNVIISTALSVNLLTTIPAGAAYIDKGSDGSEFVTADDLELMQNYLFGNAELSQEQYANSDINGDGAVDVYDLVMLRQKLLNDERELDYSYTVSGLSEGYTDALKQNDDISAAVVSPEEFESFIHTYFSTDSVSELTGKYNDEFFSTSVLLLKVLYYPEGGGETKTASCGCTSDYAGIYTTRNVNTYLNIRSDHNTASSVIGSVPANAEMKVTYGNGKWAHVEYKDIAGYVSMDYIQKKSELERTANIEVDSAAYSGGSIISSLTETADSVNSVPAVIVQIVIPKKEYYADSLEWTLNRASEPEPTVPDYQYPLAVAKLNAVGWDLRAAFNASAGIPYYGHTPDMPQTAATSMEWYADYGFTYGKGNCYVMAAMFCEMAKTLGYEAHQISGSVPLVAGGYGPHSWVEVTVNGTVYVCDPDFTNETGYNGYMITYGQSGTWRYVKETVMS